MRCREAAVLVLVGVLIGGLTARAQSTGPTAVAPASPPTTTTVPEPPKPAAIPLTQIASEAEDVTGRVRALEAGARPLEGVTAIERRLPALESRVREATDQTFRVLSESPNLTALDGLLGPWEAIGEQARTWVGVLTKRAQELERSLASLDEIQAQWTVTRAAATEAGAPPATLERIQGTLGTVTSVRERVAARRAQLLVLQDRASRIQGRSQEMLDQVQGARRAVIGRVFDRDGVPVWEYFTRAQSWRRVQGQTGESLGGDPLVRLFVAEHTDAILAGVGLFVALGLGFGCVRRRTRRWTALDEELATRFRPLDFPWASAALLTLLLVIATHPVEPRGLQALLVLVAMFPVIRLIASLTTPWLAPVVWVVGTFHFVDLVRSLIAPVPLLEQGVFQLQLLALVAAAVWLRRHVAEGVGGDEARRQLWTHVATVVLAASVVAAGAALLGYGRLARLIEFALIAVAQAGLILLALVRIVDAILGWALRVRPLRLLRAVQRHRPALEHWLHGLVRLAAVALWAASAANVLSVAGPLADRLGVVFGTRVGWGTVSVSLGDLLVFGVVVWLALRLSAGVRALLDADLFPRVDLGRGASTALSSLVHYAVLTFGFLIGLGVLGIDPTRITIIAGALGVGIGFGLQNVVNNFVSGLILLFERPVQVGDSVQLGTLTGEVKRIGIRSSTVRTFDGAEVIVPNANLVSDQVTNWTLSDRMRRIDLDLGVAYGSDPERVVAVLAEAARADPGVLPEPAPQVLFVGFGDSALNFQVRAWTARYEEWLLTRSRLGLAILAALRDAGIAIPFPQRDVHLIPDEPACPRTVKP